MPEREGLNCAFFRNSIVFCHFIRKKRSLVIPDAGDDVKPFLRQSVAVVMFLREVDTESIVLRLVPAGDDVQTKPPFTQLIGSCQLLGGNHGMNKCRVNCSENVYPLWYARVDRLPR